MVDDTFLLKPSPLMPHALLARLEDLKATPEMLARAATLNPEDLRALVEALERWPWLIPR